MKSIQEFQRRLFKGYKSSLSLPKNNRYFYGNQVEPVVPLDTKTESVLIIGAYLSAKFATIDSETDVPVAAILQNVRGQSARNELLGGKLRDLKFEDFEYPVIHLAHPGIVMRHATERNQWPILHREKHIPEVKKIIQRFV